MTPTVHASALLFGCHGILIRGPSGSGKSRLALALLQAAGQGFARLVGDDRIHIETRHGRVLMRPAKALHGLLEVRGLGIVGLPFEPVATASLVVDLAATEASRMPENESRTTEIGGVRLARLPVAPGEDPLSKIHAVFGLKSVPDLHELGQFGNTRARHPSQADSGCPI